MVVIAWFLSFIVGVRRLHFILLWMLLKSWNVVVNCHLDLVFRFWHIVCILLIIWHICFIRFELLLCSLSLLMIMRRLGPFGLLVILLVLAMPSLPIVAPWSGLRFVFLLVFIRFAFWSLSTILSLPEFLYHQCSSLETFPQIITSLLTCLEFTTKLLMNHLTKTDVLLQLWYLS